MDLRQYLIAPHEHPRQQTAHHDAPNLDQHHVTQHQSQQHHVTQQQQQHSEGETFTREQVISGLAAYPDILASILRSEDLPKNQVEEHHEAAQNNPLQTRRTSTSPLIRTLTTSSVTNKRSPKLCFWYYHTGDCTSDPMSSNYNGGRVCSDLHALDGRKEFKLHQGPWQWHKHFGNCGLELCRFSSNYKYRKEHQTKIASGTNVVKDEVGTAMAAAAVSQSTAGEDKESDVNDTAIIPTSPRAGRHGKGQRLQRQHQSPATAATPPTLKRKFSVLSSTPNIFTPDSTSSPTKKARSSGVFTRSLTTSTEYTPTLTPTHPSLPTNKSIKATVKQGKATQKAQRKALAKAKPLDIITYTLPSGSHRGIPRSSHRKAFDATCFAWYHDFCDKKGNKCRYLHALTDPPSFVQPPRGFVHSGKGGEQEVKCTRDWCPGDWLWDHDYGHEHSEEEFGDEEREEDEDEET